MILYSRMCNVCNACNARLARCYVNFFRKVSIFFKNSCEKENVRSISRQDALSRPSPQGGFFSFLLAALCARQKPLYPRRVYRQERDGGDHRFSRYSESGEAAKRTEIISPANEQYENRSRLLRYHYKQEPLRMQRKQRSGEAEYKW